MWKEKGMEALTEVDEEREIGIGPALVMSVVTSWER